MKRRMLVLVKRAAKPVKPTVKAGQEGDQVKAGQAEEDGGQGKRLIEGLRGSRTGVTRGRFRKIRPEADGCEHARASEARTEKASSEDDQEGQDDQECQEFPEEYKY